MRRKARLVPILTAIAGSTLLSTTIAHGATADTGADTGAGVAAGATAGGGTARAVPEPVEKEAADTRKEQQTVQRYWTEAKMEAARPDRKSVV